MKAAAPSLLAVLTLAAPAAAQTLPISCTVKPARVIDVAAPFPGIVSEVLVRPGAEVTEGMVLMRLDTDLARADLDLARARAEIEIEAALASARSRADGLGRRLERIRRAFQRNATSAVEFEQAQLDHALALARVEEVVAEQRALTLQVARAQLVIDKSTIRSPATGILGEGIVNAGEQVSADPLATLYVVDTLRAEAFVPVSDVPRLRGAESVTLNIDGAPIEASLDYISPIADLASNTISVFFSLPGDQAISGARCAMSLP